MKQNVTELKQEKKIYSQIFQYSSLTDKYKAKTKQNKTIVHLNKHYQPNLT